MSFRSGYVRRFKLQVEFVISNEFEVQVHPASFFATEVTKSGKTTDLYADTFGSMPQLTPVIGNGGITASVLDGDLKINRKALVERKVKPKLDDVEEKLRKVREDIRRVENGFGGDLDAIAEELAELQGNMKFDELNKDMKILAG